MSVISPSSSIRNFFKFGFNIEKAEFYRRQFPDILSVCDKLWLKWRKLSCIVLLWAFFISLNINCCRWTFQRRNQFLSFPHVQVVRELSVLNISTSTSATKWWESCQYWIFFLCIEYFFPVLNISSKHWIFPPSGEYFFFKYWIFSPSTEYFLQVVRELPVLNISCPATIECPGQLYNVGLQRWEETAD